MQEPDEVLGVPRGASLEVIRARYLELVRQFPPDRAPERFAEIREAYELLRDPVRHMELDLFDFKPRETINEIVDDYARGPGRKMRVPLKTILSMAERL